MFHAESLPNKSEIDTAKGVGIALVVVGHMAYPLFHITHIYMYHMPLFFFLSGVGIKNNKKISESIYFDFKNILLYAAIMTFVYSVVGKAVFLSTGLNFVKFQGFGIENYTTKLITENSHHVLFFLVGWFLVALFFARSLALVTVKAIGALPSFFVSPAILIAAFVFCYVGMRPLANLFHGTLNPYANLAAQVAVATGFILLGRWATLNQTILRLVRHPLAGFALAIALYEAALLLGAKPLSMAWSEYPAGFQLHMLGAILGILLILNISFAVSRIRPDNILCAVGRRSKAIMSHHLFTFFLVNVALASFGVVALKDINIWSSFRPEVTWPLYAGLGIAVPILLEEIRLRAFNAIGTRARALLAGRFGNRFGGRSTAAASGD